MQNTPMALARHEFQCLWCHIRLKLEMAASISRLTKFRQDWAASPTMIRPNRKCSLFSQALEAPHYD